MTIDEMKCKLQKTMSHKRYIHSINVMKSAAKLASIYGEDIDKAAIAGLLHDCARDIKGEEALNLCAKYDIPVDDVTRTQPDLLHGPIGSRLARDEYEVSDKDILNAISCHTTGGSDMSMLDKIIFIADYVEPNRNFPAIDDVRKIVDFDIDGAIVMALNRTIKYILAKGVLIHPDTVIARNSIIAAKHTGKHDMGD